MSPNLSRVYSPELTGILENDSQIAAFSRQEKPSKPPAISPSIIGNFPQPRACGANFNNRYKSCSIKNYNGPFERTNIPGGHLIVSGGSNFRNDFEDCTVENYNTPSPYHELHGTRNAVNNSAHIDHAGLQTHGANFENRYQGCTVVNYDGPLEGMSGGSNFRNDFVDCRVENRNTRAPYHDTSPPAYAEPPTSAPEPTSALVSVDENRTSSNVEDYGGSECNTSILAPSPLYTSVFLPDSEQDTSSRTASPFPSSIFLSDSEWDTSSRIASPFPSSRIVPDSTTTNASHVVTPIVASRPTAPNYPLTPKLYTSGDSTVSSAPGQSTSVTYRRGRLAQGIQDAGCASTRASSPFPSSPVISDSTSTSSLPAVMPVFTLTPSIVGPTPPINASPSTAPNNPFVRKLRTRAYSTVSSAASLGRSTSISHNVLRRRRGTPAHGMLDTGLDVSLSDSSDPATPVALEPLTDSHAESQSTHGELSRPNSPDPPADAVPADSDVSLLDSSNPATPVTPEPLTDSLAEPQSTNGERSQSNSPDAFVPTPLPDPSPRWFIQVFHTLYGLLLLGRPSNYYERATPMFTIIRCLSASSDRNANSEDLSQKWKDFLDELREHWNISIVLSGLVTIGGALPISKTEYLMTDIPAYLSIICALMSEIYALISKYDFAALTDEQSAIGWIKEAEQSNHQTVWNCWVALSLPIVWAAWSVVFLMLAVMAMIWHQGAALDSGDGNPKQDQSIGVKVVLTVFIMVGIICLFLMLKGMRRRWKDSERCRKDLEGGS